MSTLPNLPVEVIDLIVDKVIDSGHNKTIATCLAVCHYFSERLRPFVYHEVALAAPDPGYNSCEKFSKLLAASPHVAAHVRTLAIHQGYHTGFDKYEWTRGETALIHIMPALGSTLTELRISQLDIPGFTPFSILRHITSLKLEGVSFSCGSPIPFISAFPELERLSIGNLRSSSSGSVQRPPRHTLTKLVALEVTSTYYAEELYLNSLLSMLPTPSALKTLAYPWLSRQDLAPQHHALADNAPGLEELILIEGMPGMEDLPPIPRVHGRAIKRLTLRVLFRYLWDPPVLAVSQETLNWVTRIFQPGEDEAWSLEEVTFQFVVSNIMAVGEELEAEWKTLAGVLADGMGSTLRRVKLSFIGTPPAWRGETEYSSWDIEDKITWMAGLFDPCRRRGELQIARLGRLARDSE